MINRYCEQMFRSVTLSVQNMYQFMLIYTQFFFVLFSLKIIVSVIYLMIICKMLTSSNEELDVKYWCPK